MTPVSQRAVAASSASPGSPSIAGFSSFASSASGERKRAGWKVVILCSRPSSLPFASKTIQPGSTKLRGFSSYVSHSPRPAFIRTGMKCSFTKELTRGHEKGPAIM